MAFLLNTYADIFPGYRQPQIRQAEPPTWSTLPPPFTNALFSGNHLHAAILTDFHQGDKRKVNDLEESGLLRAGHLFPASRFTGQTESDIEDMLGREFYVQIVNHCYQLEEEAIQRVTTETPPMRVLDEVQGHFRTVATKGSEFDHYTPAVYLNPNPPMDRDGRGEDTGSGERK